MEKLEKCQRILEHPACGNPVTYKFMSHFKVYATQIRDLFNVKFLARRMFLIMLILFSD